MISAKRLSPLRILAVFTAVLAMAACLPGSTTAPQWVDEGVGFLPSGDGADIGEFCAASAQCRRGLRCLKEGLNQTCVRACLADNNGCPGTQSCEPVANAEEGYCADDPDAVDEPETDLEPDEDATPTVPDEDTVSNPGDEDNAECSSDFEAEVIRLVNLSRAEEGLGPLVCHTALAAVARAHSADMYERDFFDHTNPDGLGPFDRMSDAGIEYGGAGENIAAGYTTPEAVHDGWMNSPGHRANIMTDGFEQIGVGHVNGDGFHYWTQLFMSAR